jgi:hypothetical protein
MLARAPTAALAAAGLIAGFGVAVGTGSRPLGGLVLAVFGIACIAIWSRRHGRGLIAKLTIAGLVAFALSHVVGLLIGAWPAVLVSSAAIAAIYWRVSDRAVAGRYRPRPAPPVANP